MKCRQHYSSANGFATVLTLLGMLLVVVSLPIATKLVQQNQDNRSSAATDTTYDIPKGGHEIECDKGDTKCIDGFINNCNSSYRWTKTSQSCSDPKVTPGVPLCTTVRYGSWSACVNGKQTRTVTKEPTNCSGGVTVGPSEQTCTIPTITTTVPINPGGHEIECDKGETKCINGYTNTCNSSYRWVKTTKTCVDPKVTPGTPLCTIVRYGSWSTCVNGKQTRTVTKTPTNCSGGVPVLPSEQPCVVKPTCTSFDVGPWGACNQFAGGDFQLRTVTGSPTGCTGGNPPLSRQTCVVTTSHTPVCGSAEGACVVGVPGQVNKNSTTGESKWNCVIAGYYTEAGNFVNPKTTVNCSYTDKNVNCGSLNTPSSCRSAGCSWETEVKACTSKNIPIAACGGATIGTQKCVNQSSSAICTKTGWDTTSCNMLTQRCFNNTCENKKEYYEDHTPCAKSTYHLQAAYSSDACPEGYSCNRFTETCEVVDASAGKKGTGGNCSTDADCLSGYCVSDQNGKNSLSPQMYCKQISQEESIDELYMKGTEAIGNILAITAGVVGVVEYGPSLANGIINYIKGGYKSSDRITSLESLKKIYGVSENATVEETKEAIRKYSYTNGYPVKQNDLVASLTGVNSADESSVFDYLIADMYTFSSKYNQPNPTTYSSTDSFISALVEQNKGANYIQGDQAILSRLSADPDLLTWYRDNETGGFFVPSPQYASDVFLVQGSPGTMAHETLHLNQYAKYGANLSQYYGEAASVVSEYEAHAYGIMTNYLNNTGANDVVDKLIWGITGSTGLTPIEIVSSLLY